MYKLRVKNMILSKLMRYSAICIGLFAFGELYSKFVIPMTSKRLGIVEDDYEVEELICTRKSKEYFDYSDIVCQIPKFEREPTLFITELLENLILSARRTVHLAMYIFTSSYLANALISARKRGVKIYVITDHSMDSASGTQIQKLKENGIAVKICFSNTLHHKFCLIDVPYNNGVFATEGENSESIDYSVHDDDEGSIKIPKNGLYFGGSLNYTREGLTTNYENFTILSGQKVVGPAFEEFVDRWRGSNDA